MNIAIIGSNGFIGSHLTNYISQNAENKIVLFGRNIKSVLSSDLPYYQLESLNQEQFDAIFGKIDIVYYLASGTIPSSSWENPIIEIEKNLLPFLNFTEKISKLAVKKIVFVSSAGTIYGPSLQKVKENSDKNPFSPYGIIKLTIEHFLNYIKLKNGINFDIYRVSNVYGEGQKTSNGLGIINTFIENILTKHQVQIYGDGNNIRNYIYINDVVKFLSNSIISDINQSNIFNIASNDTISVNRLIEILKNSIPIDFEVNYVESRKSDNTIIEIDNSKILDYNPNFEFTSIQNGIMQTYNFIKNNGLKEAFDK
jgi:UDP-glucose 4-epimerase